MTDHPILFQGPMVRALIEGNETQTRRICKGLPIIENAKYKTGDRLYVRENARFPHSFDDVKPRDIPNNLYDVKIRYEADGGRTRPKEPWGRIRPSIHIPCYFSRLWLRVEKVRIQRLNEISEVDAIAEGVQRDKFPGITFNGGEFFFVPGVLDRRLDPPNNYLTRSSAVEMFAALWDTVNGSGEWLKNPYVFAYTLKRINRPVGG